jgi:hypothetical protein
MVVRICLYGKHACRTPLAYKPYQDALRDKIQITADPLNADLLVTGFSKDFYDNSSSLEQILEKRADLKLAVISEEPLWDSIYSLNYQDSITPNRCVISCPGKFNFYYYAYHNSSIFEYESIPYFLTTDLQFPIRYLMLISSWLLSSPGERLKYYAQKKNQFFMLAEKRNEKWFDYVNKEINLSSLCIARSDIGSALLNSVGMNVIGKGFTEEHAPRQSLYDWHLDKLSIAYKKYNIISALENTLHASYVTEKLFDAFACCSMPLYCANSGHSILSNLRLSSFINIYGRSCDETASLVRSFGWTPDIVQGYEYDAHQIFLRLKNWDGIINDVTRRSSLMLKIIMEDILG